jgi:hypothetical protein
MKKFFCTCAGCVAGFVCIALTGGGATPLVAAGLIGGGTITGYFIGDKQEKDEKKLRNQGQTIANQTKAIENITKENQDANSEIERLKKQHEENQEQKQRDLKELEQAKNKANDPNLTEDERKY